jgi:hypothetical protein
LELDKKINKNTNIEVIKIKYKEYLFIRVFLCLKIPKQIIVTKIIVFILLFNGIKKFKTNAKKDKNIIPFKEVSQKNEKVESIFFLKIEPIR